MAWSIFTDGGGPLVAVGWAQQFLKYINAPVTPGNVEFIYQWEKSEGGGGKYNPLNTGVIKGHENLVTSGNQFGGGAADYASWTAGLQGSMYGIELPYYTDVVKNLRANNPTAARTALWNSPWAASHYGHGTNWYFGTVPNGQPVLPSTVPPGIVSTTEHLLHGSTDTCAWNLSLFTGNLCVLTKTQVRAMIAVGLGVLGLATGLVGAILLVSYGLKPMAGKAEEVAKYIPGAGTAVRAAKATAPNRATPVP